MIESHVITTGSATNPGLSGRMRVAASETDATPQPRRPDGPVSFAQPTAVSADLLKPLPSVWNALLLALVGAVFVLIVWSAFAQLRETTKGSGRVIPASKIQVVQNLEGGIVREVVVREGQFIEAGDVLLRIDPTQAGASHGEGLQRLAGLEALAERLAAEVDRRPLAFSEALERSNPAFVGWQSTLYEARKSEHDASVGALLSQRRQREQELKELSAKRETLARALDLVRREVAIIRPLATSGAASQAELLAAETKLNDTNGALQAAELSIPRVTAQRDEVVQRHIELEARFRREAISELSKVRIELAALTQSNRRAADTVSRTVVRAPASGIIKTIHVTTPGQVVQPGSNLVEIVPQNDSLLVEARIRPQDIAFLRPGQPALVKVTAYDFSLFGGLDGRLERIGADSTTDDKGETYYLIQVRTNANHIENRGKKLPIIPGMVAEVDIVTGSRTVLAYMTKPLTRMRDVALTER